MGIYVTFERRLSDFYPSLLISILKSVEIYAEFSSITLFSEVFYIHFFIVYLQENNLE
jgi:hypothetical protein